MNAEALTRRLQDRLDLFNARSSAEAGFTLSASMGVTTREPDRPEDDRRDAEPGRSPHVRTEEEPEGRRGRARQAAGPVEVASASPDGLEFGVPAVIFLALLFLQKSRRFSWLSA